MSIDSKLLTVSIAAYNVESSLERTLNSLECDESLFELLDIIVVDDGSKDRTAEIASGFAARHPMNVRVISKKNGGYGSTVNTSVSLAEGIYYKLLDGDDVFETSELEKLIHILKSHVQADLDGKEAAPDLVITPFKLARFSSNDKNFEFTLSDRHRMLQTTPVIMEEANLTDGLMMFELCVKTDVLRKADVDLTEHCFYTDNEYVMTAELYASTVVRCPFPVYVYSIGVEGQSMSVEGRVRHFEDKIKASYGVFEIYRNYIDSNGSLSGSRKLVSDKLISTMVREVYVSLMLQDDPGAKRQILYDFDRKLMERWPYAYEVSQGSKLVNTARRSGKLLYPFICSRVLKAEQARMGSTCPENDIALKAAEYLAAACMIIQCRTVYMHLETWGMIVNRSVWLIMMIALMTCVIRGDSDKRLQDRRGALFTVLAVTAYTGIFLIANPVNYLRVIRCASAVLMMILLLRTSKGKERSLSILGCFRDLMLIIACASLVFWVLGSIIKVLPCTGYLYMDWSHTGEYVRIPTFLCLYFETQWTPWELVQARNCGIFVEAPMAGFAYSVALMAEIFVHRSRKPRHLVNMTLLTVAILSTLSLICYGFLLLVAAFSYSGVILKGKAGRSSKIAVGTAFAAAAVVLMIFTIDKLDSSSAITRVNDFAVGLNAWLAHPVFGGGFESLEYLQSFMPEWRSYDIGFSNSPMEILAQGGLYIGIPYIYGFMSSLIRGIRNKEHRRIAVTIIFAYLFTFIVVPYQYISFFIIVLLASRQIFGNQIADE